MPINNKHIPSKKYFVLYLTYEVAHLLIEDVRVPTDLRILNEKISSLAVHAQPTPVSIKSIKSPSKDEISSLI